MKTIQIIGIFFLVTFISTNLFAAELAIKTAPKLIVKEPVAAPAPAVVAPAPSIASPTIAPAIRVPTTALPIREPSLAPTVKTPILTPVIKEPLMRAPTTAIRVNEPAPSVKIREPVTIKTPVTPVRVKEPVSSDRQGVVPGNPHAVIGTFNDSSGKGQGIKRNPLGEATPDRTDRSNGQESKDINNVVRGVLRQSYQETSSDLKTHTDKVRNFNDSKKAVRENLNELRDVKRESNEKLLENAAPDPSASPFGKKISRLMNTGKTDALANELQVYKVSIEQKGADRDFYIGKLHEANEISAAMATHVREVTDAHFVVPENIKLEEGMGPREMSQQLLKQSEFFRRYAEGMKSRISSWEDELGNLGDDAQLANIDLQNMLQKQQQTIQMMSNISKVLHDTALAVIRKIG